MLQEFLIRYRNERRALFNDAAIKPGPIPADVLAYWRAKSLQPGFDYRDVWNEEHDFAFTAAKIMRHDVLEAMRGELERAFEEGVPFEQWKREIEPRMKALGWWEPQDVRDPITEKVVKVNPPGRLNTIYQTNMRTARSVGQYDRVQRQKRSRPYLLYLVGPSARHREQHLAWHGLLLPVDDPFWRYAFPPNGWGCKCNVRAVSRREADDLEDEGVLTPEPEPVLDDDGNPTGHVVEKRIPVTRTAPALELIPWENKRTGHTELVPRGIDPGFHHTPGEGRKLALVEP
jgi:hypothetical protein